MNIAAQILNGEQLASRVGQDTFVGPASPLNAIGLEAATATAMRAVRCVVPRRGTLVDLHMYVGVASGTALGAVYDTAPTTRTRLWMSPSAVTVAAGWVKLGDPGIAVRAGQAIDLALTTDNTTMTIGRMASAAAAGVNALPAAFAAAGTGKPILAWTASGATPPATVAESALTAVAVIPMLIARVA